jgi:hypothetical protein
VILQQEHEGYNWHTDDPAHLYISNTGHLPQGPKEVTAFIIGRGGVVRPATRVLKLETLKFMGCGLFGEGRPCGFDARTRWTGDAFKFGIYEEGTRNIVIIRTDGAGTTAYAVDETDALDTWVKILAILPREQVWNLCATITDTYRKGCGDERRRVFQLFLRGKLRKRKTHGAVRVEVLSEGETVCESAESAT